MDQENDQVKQQSDRQLEILKTRRRIEENRAHFYTQRQHELEEAHQARKQAKDDAKERQQKLRQQVMLARRFVKERTA